MAQMKEHRRVTITKRTIKETFIDLMQTYPLSKVSVKMLCEAADINRSTFYAHYTDPYDLLRQIQHEVIDEIRTLIIHKKFTEDQQMTVPVLTRLLEYARDNQRLFKVVINDKDTSYFNEQLMQLVQDKSLQEIRSDQRLDRSVSTYLEIFIITGFISIVQQWLDNGTPETPQHMAELITRVLFQGASGFYECR